MGARRFGFFVVGLVLASACRDEPARPSARASTVREPLIAQDQYFLGTDLPDKTLVLTFDDGPSPLAAASDLSAWLKNRPSPIRAVFFLNGGCIAATQLPDESCDGNLTVNPYAVIGQELANGHLVGNHTTTHRDLTTLGAAEIVADVTETDNEIASYMPWNRQFFRAPFGNYDSSVYAALAASPMSKYVGPIYWNIGGGPTDASRAADWECWELGYTTRQCGDLYLNETHALRRGIVLMHDRYGDLANHDLDNGTGNSIDMVKYVIPILESEGYTFKALWEDPAIAAALPSCAASCASCSGPSASQCTSCAAGSYLAGVACTPCSACAGGTYVQTACTATANTVCGTCAGCAAGTYASVGCSATADTVCSACDASCTTCSGAGASACASCATGKFLATGVCSACSVCGSGHFQQAACTATSDTSCGACDSSCSACAGPAKEQCGTCLPGFYVADNACRACSVCAAGTFVATACSVTTDTICTACDPGSASTDAGAPSCDKCPPGTFAGSAGRSSCTPCGTCDDKDPCTDDSCIPTAGCVHAHKAGCMGPQPPTAAPEAGGAHDGDIGDGATDPGSSCAMASRPLPARGGEGGPAAFMLALLALGAAARRERDPRG